MVEQQPVLTTTAKHIAAYFLLSIGCVLLYLGARDLWESRAGQSDAEEILASPPPQKITPTTIPAGSPVAELSIPRLGTRLFVIEGSGKKELRMGPGHLIGTKMPGTRGNCVIAGHRDTHFRVLKDVRVGDDLLLQTSAGEFLYRVSNTSVVQPMDTRSLQPSSDAVLHLITCYPFSYVGAAPERFVVEARFEGKFTVRMEKCPTVPTSFTGFKNFPLTFSPS